ncbi:PKD2, partial [Symbiodinium necroappetens]
MASVTIVACTWNLGCKKQTAALPGADAFRWLADLCRGTRASLVALGLQELHPDHLAPLRDRVLEVLRAEDDEEAPLEVLASVHCDSYLPLLVFERAPQSNQVLSLPFTFDDKKVCSKGCIAVECPRQGISLCIANAHLEAGHGKTEVRDATFAQIGKCVEDSQHSLFIVLGDLNYRLQGLPGKTIEEPTKATPPDKRSPDFLSEFEALTSAFEEGDVTPEMGKENKQCVASHDAPARLQKMAAHRVRLNLSRKVVQVPEMPMTETSLDVLFLNHSLRPPLNELYLKETKAFYASKIHFFNGKHWQLRTLTANEKHYIVPILVNTGGIAYNRPIFADFVQMHFLPNYQRSMWHGHTKRHVQIPTPLGDGMSIDQVWPGGGGNRFGTEEELRKPSSIAFNLVGHELAEVIVECNGLVGNLESMTERGRPREYLQEVRQDMIQATAERFAKQGATVDTIEREISAMSADPMTTWDEASLPVPDELWVNVYQNDIDCDNFLK